MKKLIAWDTSSKKGVITTFQWHEGANERPELVSEWTLDLDAGHSERLLWGIHQVLEGCRWKVEEIDVFGVGLGPGSFTGLRIGVTTARTLAQIMNRPLVGVSSLAALARPAAQWAQSFIDDSTEAALIVASTDACKGELFSLYGWAPSVADCVVRAEGDHPGLWKRGVEELALTPSSLMEQIEKKLEQSKKKMHYIRVGNGRSRYLDYWKKLPAEQELSYPIEYADRILAHSLGTLVWEGYQAGIERNALQWNPQYLRASNAELKKLAGELPNLKLRTKIQE